MRDVIYKMRKEKNNLMGKVVTQIKINKEKKKLFQKSTWKKIKQKINRNLLEIKNYAYP